MTAPDPPAPGASQPPLDPEPRDAVPVEPEPVEPEPSTLAGPGRPGITAFTIEGRRAPALFVIGWIAFVVGLGTIAVALLSGGGGAAPVLLLAGLVLLSIGLVAGAGSQAIERPGRGTGAYTGPSPLIVFAASVPVSVLAVVLLGIPLSLVGLAVDGPAGRLASVAAQAVVYLGLIRLLVVDTGALGWGAMGLRRLDARALVELGQGALWALPVIAATIPVVAVLSAVFPVTPASPLPPAGETIGFLGNLLAGVIIAPIAEEILFRGFATTAWAADLGPRRALIRGALFFAVAHVLTITAGTASEALALAAIGFASRVPVALALGWLFLRRGSIWAPIGLHAAFNLALLTLAEVAAGAS